MFFQSCKMAWSAIGANKMRTFLTMLGIIIGVASLIVLVSITEGATTSVSEQISDIGSNYLTVSVSDDKENPLRLSEFTSLLQDDVFSASSPAAMTSVTAKSGYTDETMRLTGVTGGYFQIMDSQLAYGRFLKQTDVENHSYVVVITADTATEFFGHENAAGETLTLDGRKFLVAGVLSGEDSDTLSSMGGSQGDSTENTSVTLEGYIPYSTMTRIADNVLDITQFYVSSADENSMEKAEQTLETILLERFENDEDAFSIVDQSQVMEAMENVDHTMSLMLGGIAAISLLVGGIGIMNIMMVSVTERTREIGIRKAIGAKRGSILSQFLIEAFLVSILGCAAGIGISWVILKAAELFMDGSMEFQMSMEVVGIAVAFSSVTGILFGLYPASLAAGKRPIDALRHTT